MRKGILDFLLVFALIASGIIIALLYSTNGELKEQVAQREKLIRRNQASDSLSCEHAEKYTATVTKYITNDCNLLVDGKELSLEQFVTIYANKEDERIFLQQRLNTILTSLADLEKGVKRLGRAQALAQDSLALSKTQLKSIVKRFGIKTRIRSEGKYSIVEYESKKIDSALVLLGVFRNRISYDSTSRRWAVRMQ